MLCNCQVNCLNLSANDVPGKHNERRKCSHVLNKKMFASLDRDHAHIVTTLRERDLYFDGTQGSDERPLPKNNQKQQEAIDKALTSRFTLIQGPPGK